MIIIETDLRKGQRETKMDKEDKKWRIKRILELIIQRK